MARGNMVTIEKTHPAPDGRGWNELRRGSFRSGKIYSSSFQLKINYYLAFIFIKCSVLSCLGAVARRAEVLGAGWVFSIKCGPIAVTLPKTRKPWKSWKTAQKPLFWVPPFPYIKDIFSSKKGSIRIAGNGHSTKKGLKLWDFGVSKKGLFLAIFGHFWDFLNFGIFGCFLESGVLGSFFGGLG